MADVGEGGLVTELQQEVEKMLTREACSLVTSTESVDSASLQALLNQATVLVQYFHCLQRIKVSS